MTKKLLFGSVAFSAAVSTLWAQAGLGADTNVSYFEMDLFFFAALVAGVLLAIGFQILLTSLSAGFGVSAIGNLDDKFHNRDRHSDSHSEHNSDSGKGGSVMVKISNAWGAWMLATASISLFFATWMGVTLSSAAAVWTGVVIGLSIWGAAWAIMMWLDMRMMSNLVGGGASAVMAGLRGSGSALSGIFSSSPEKQMGKQIQKVADHTVDKIRAEIADAMDHGKFQKKLEKYIHELAPPQIDYTRARKEMETLLKEIKLKEKDHFADDSDIDRETFIEIASKHPNVSREDAKKLGDIFNQVRGAHAEGGSGSEQAARIMDRLSPGSEDDASGIRHKVAEFLRSTQREELAPEALKEDLDKIIADPKATKEVVMRRVGQIDRDTVVTALSQRTDIDRDRAEKVVGYVEKALGQIRSRVETTREGVEQHRSAMTDRPENPRPTRSGHKGTLTEEMEAKIARYLNSLQRPELNYRSLKADLESILHEPGAAPEVLRERLSKFDRDTFVAVASSNPRVSREQAERMADRAMEARDNAIRRSEEIQHKVEERLRSARDTAIHEAENLRKASAAAAWWTFGAALVSGAAAALGGALAATGI